MFDLFVFRLISMLIKRKFVYLPHLSTINVHNMKTSILSFLLLTGICFVSCHEELHIPQRQCLDLSGVWQTNLGDCRLPGTTDENHLGSGEHPTDMTTQLTRLYPYEGVVDYTRKIDIPVSMSDKRLTLIMERTKPSTLWVDGDSIGSLDHLYAPHTYLLPALSAGSHTLHIRVDNRSERMPAPGILGSHAWTDATQTNWNGVLGRFCIEATPRHFYIDNVQVYPDVEKHVAEVRWDVVTQDTCLVGVWMNGVSWNSDQPQQKIGVGRQELKLQAGVNHLSRVVPMPEDQLLWSEFHPALYRLGVFVEDMWGEQDAQEVSFGMRKFGSQPYIAAEVQGEHVQVGDTIGWLFTINDKRTFLRGKHDACVFPLTGYAPMDVESWREVFQMAKRYGVNHYRCHSYTPPQAAFLAADIEGVYMETELPYWGTITREDSTLNNFLLREGKMLLDQLGNSPSLMMVGLGNELSGDYSVMREMVNELRAMDQRHLYNFGANDHLGWMGPQDGEDCFITCRVGGWAPDAPVPGGFSSHVRSSFSFADADDGGILNGLRPSTSLNYTHAVRLSPRPVVSHETCQFQVYPDYDEIKKYTGVLYPYNYEVFRNRLAENGLSEQASAFHHATGEWAMDCYKADIELVLRTPGMAGYQMLDLQDYPGQGSALCGVLDAFMDSKGIITEEDFRQFCSPVVPLALMDSLCFWNDQPMNISVAISNFLEEDFCQAVNLRLEGDGFLYSTTIAPSTIPNGRLCTVGRVSLSDELCSITQPKQLSLTLMAGEYSNQYHVWVYPREKEKSGEVLVAQSLDAAARQRLVEGGKVLLVPDHSAIDAQSVGGLFTPDYWNYAMFKSISENNHRPVSPGTLGLLYNAQNPLFQAFPGMGRTDWQWWSIVRNSRPLVLNSLDKDYRPLLQMVDNVERNHKLGLLTELKVGAGALMICTTDLDAIGRYPEGMAYRKALLDYMNSADFAPAFETTIEQVLQLLTGVAEVKDIQGVKNISDYQRME